jgi:hypothetical protein
VLRRGEGQMGGHGNTSIGSTAVAVHPDLFVKVHQPVRHVGQPILTPAG